MLLNLYGKMMKSIYDGGWRLGDSSNTYAGSLCPDPFPDEELLCGQAVTFTDIAENSLRTEPALDGKIGCIAAGSKTEYGSMVENRQ